VYVSPVGKPELELFNVELNPQAIVAEPKLNKNINSINPIKIFRGFILIYL
jgi:hypothetical protein